MSTLLVFSPDEGLFRDVAGPIETITNWLVRRVERASEAQQALREGGVRAIVLDCRHDAFENELYDLLSWLDEATEIELPRVLGLTSRGYPQRLWILVDRLVSQHATPPLDPIELARSLKGRANIPEVILHASRDARRLEANGLKYHTRTPALFSTLSQLERVARHNVTILFTGETGTGKSYLAQLVHELSDRKSGPFFAVACGALPPDLIESELFGHVRGAFTTAVRSAEGRFEAAKGGTLLLDEIDVLGPKEQSKLLHVIETGKYEPVGSSETRVADVRLIVASNVHLKALAERHQFRLDLYYRLNVLEFHLPPLRERPHDMMGLASQFIEDSSRRHNIAVSHMDARFLEVLKRYHWPGNIRELLNQMRRAVLLCREGILTPDCLSLDLDTIPRESSSNGRRGVKPAGWNLHRRLAHSEREYLVETLQAHSNNRAATARALGISRTALYKKLQRLGLLATDIADELSSAMPPEAASALVPREALAD